jgi:hypothetical protein
VTASLPVQGLSYLQVTVLSVDGNLAFVRADQAAGRTLYVRRDFLRAQSPLPQPGQTWVIERPYGVDGWMFSAILGGDVQTPMMVVPNAAARNAIAAPYVDQAVYQLDTYSAWRWTGSAWQERVSPSFTALQAQVNALPRGLVKIIRWPSDITLTSTTSILMESLVAPVVAGRSYELLWHCNQAGSLAAGPPNGFATLVSASGSVVAGSPSLRNTGIRVYNATQEVITLTATFDATVTENRAFGVAANSGSASSSITFYGGLGRFLSVKDVGLTPS